MAQNTSIWNNCLNENTSNIENYNALNPIEMETQCKSLLFDDLCIRKNFMRKVYSILMVQLLLTFAIVANFAFNETLKAFVLRNPFLFWLGFFVLLVTMLIMACFDDVRRQTPLNYIFLLIFTLAQSFMLGIVICQYAFNEILVSVGITALVCLALSLYARQSKYDFTMMGGVLLVAVVVFLISALLIIFFPLRAMVLLYSIMGAILFSVFMIYDIQLMMGGQHKYALSPEEYVFAALNLYLDIINIFFYVLSLISSSRT